MYEDILGNSVWLGSIQSYYNSYWCDTSERTRCNQDLCSTRYPWQPLVEVMWLQILHAIKPLMYRNKRITYVNINANFCCIIIRGWNPFFSFVA